MSSINDFTFTNTPNDINDINDTNKPKYVIEGGLNFKEMLENSDDEEMLVDKCLISNEPLDNTKITLKCNHSFNYFHLYKQLFSQQFSKNPYNGSHHIKMCIQCPYCRSITEGLLPPSIDLRCNSKNYVTSYTNYIGVKCKIDDCKEPSFVTPIGYYCKKHYSQLKKNNIKIKTNVKIKTKTYVKSKNIIIIDPCNNIITYDTSNNVIINVLTTHNSDFNLEQETYKMKHTQEYMKNVLKNASKTISGNKTQLTMRIFSHGLQNM